ncbi:MAG: hypothetical protein WA869_10805 [Alloacidobacterium sp.]|jgi:hypothetical protein
MFTEVQVEKQSSTGKLIFYAMIVSGVVAAYLMYRRGESLVSIATKTVTNPVGSLISEVKNTV